MIWPAVQNHASHHQDLARLKRVFDYVPRLIEELVQALAVRLEQLRGEEARARPTQPWGKLPPMRSAYVKSEDGNYTPMMGLRFSEE
jgi:hypothetical protein